ncbi:OmpA family protein [Pseudomonas sp. M20]|uniref:OmpA family protein n=1 Tax=Pseudomonas sp. M20 TaxID=3379129 RepID=UPI00386F51F0
MITGHTNATGGVEQNRALTHARASAVRDWKQRMDDIVDSCFAVQGFTANQPVASNDTETGVQIPI